MSCTPVTPSLLRGPLLLPTRLYSMPLPGVRDHQKLL